jgi:hypothetical protein
MIVFDIGFDIIWYDMIDVMIYMIYDMIYDTNWLIYDIYDMICLLTAVGLSPGGSTHLHTNSTKNNTNNK